MTVGEYLTCVRRGGCAEPEWREKGNKYNARTGAESLYRNLGDALTGERHPIVGINWENARQYAEWLKYNTGKDYRLPSEAEWEYAARAGTSTKYPWGDAPGNDRANCDDGCDDRFKHTSPVGSFRANSFGLYDTSGNLWEWVEDCWHEDFRGAPTDGSAWTSGGECTRRVLRGGCWFVDAKASRSASRTKFEPDYKNVIFGIRVVRALSP